MILSLNSLKAIFIEKYAISKRLNRKPTRLVLLLQFINRSQVKNTNKNKI